MPDRHQAITRTSVDFLAVRSSDIHKFHQWHLRAICY